MASIDLTQENFDETIMNNEVIVIDFWAEWCGPCKAFERVIDEVAAEHPDVLFAKINIEQEKELAADFNVMSIPLTMIFRRNFAVFSQSGIMPASALNDLIQQAKALDMESIRKNLEGSQQD